MQLGADDGVEMLHNMAVDVLVAGKVNLPSNLEKDIDSVTLESVSAVCILISYVSSCTVRSGSYKNLSILACCHYVKFTVTHVA